MEGAVELQPPTDGQIRRYLDYLEATGSDLADIRGSLTTDENLRDLLRSPLMLHVIALAYHGRPVPVLRQSGSAEDRRQRLWKAYVDRMFEQRPIPSNCGYTLTEAIAWLANALRDRDLTEFYLDRLIPDWIPATDRQERRLAHLLWYPATDWLRPVEELHWSWRKVNFTLGRLVGLIATVIGGGLTWALATLSAYSYGHHLSKSLGIVALVGLVFCVGITVLAALSLGWTAELREERSVALKAEVDRRLPELKTQLNSPQMDEEKLSTEYERLRANVETNRAQNEATNATSLALSAEAQNKADAARSTIAAQDDPD